MSRADDVAMYQTAVRTRLGRKLEAEEVELMRDLYDDDVSADECAEQLKHHAATLRFTTRN